MLFARTAIVMFLGCLYVLSVRAQQDACQQRTILVSVETRDGAPAPELSSADLAGTFRHKAVHIKHVGLEQMLPRIILLIDTSGSMQGTQNQALDIAEELLSKIPPAAEVGVAFFTKDMLPVSLPTSDRVKLKDQLEGLRKNATTYKGRTALWASVLGSVKMFGTPQVGDAIYLISDGGDNASKSSEHEVAVTLTHAGVRVFGLTFRSPEEIHRPPEEAEGWVYMQQMIEDTGGANVVFHGGLNIGYFPTPEHPALLDKSGRPTQLGLSLDEQFRELMNSYRVDIDLPKTVDKPREWKLGLVGLSKPQRDNLVLRYPRLLVPCH
jgi:von Willebrand factor type A domain